MKTHRSSKREKRANLNQMLRRVRESLKEWLAENPEQEWERTWE